MIRRLAAAVAAAVLVAGAAGVFPWEPVDSINAPVCLMARYGVTGGGCHAKKLPLRREIRP